MIYRADTFYRTQKISKILVGPPGIDDQEEQIGYFGQILANIE